MPITIESEEYQFDLLIHTVAAGKTEPGFNLFLDVKETLVIFPVKFEIEVIDQNGVVETEGLGENRSTESAQSTEESQDSDTPSASTK